jgi:hypothetical protein
MFGDGFNLLAEDVAGAENAETPDQRAESIEEQEFARAHVKNAGQRRRDGAQSGNEFGKQQGTRTLFGEDALGAADAGVGFEGNFAEQLQDVDALGFAEQIPDAVGGEGCDGD